MEYMWQHLTPRGYHCSDKSAKCTSLDGYLCINVFGNNLFLRQKYNVVLLVALFKPPYTYLNFQYICKFLNCCQTNNEKGH